MNVRKKPQALPVLSSTRVRGEQFRTDRAVNSGCSRSVRCYRVILLLQDAAGRVDKAPAGFHQPRRGLQNAALLRCELRNRLGAVPPFQVRVAPQRAEAAARRVDQNAIELSGETPGARTVFSQHEGVDIGYPGARRARRERREAPGRHIHGVDAAGAAHQHRRSERLAAGAGAVIGDHLAPPRGEQPGEKLASFVLNLDEPLREKPVAIDGRPAGEAQPAGEYGVGVACKPSAESSACALARSVRARLTRKSSGAGFKRPCAMRSASGAPCSRARRSHSQSGRSARMASGRSAEGAWRSLRSRLSSKSL